MTSKPSYISHKIFDNDLFAIFKRKVILTLKKTNICSDVYIRLGKVLKYGFHYRYFKIKYSSN